MERRAEPAPSMAEELLEAELLVAYFAWAEAPRNSIRREIAWERYVRARDAGESTVH